MGNLVKRTAVASLAVITMGVAGQSLAQACSETLSVPVKGKINNNGQPNLGLPPEGMGFSTLGVVSLNGGRILGSMKCGLVSTLVAPPANEYSTPSFIHTMSCDDEFELPGGLVMHSQLSFDTTGQIVGGEYLGCETSEVPGKIPPPGLVYFTETSTPRLGPGNRGAFMYTTGGGIDITGTINNCTGAIDMKFEGEIEICMDSL